MKKSLYSLALFLLLTTFLSGCAINKSNKSANSNSKDRFPRVLDFGQPERRPDITGLVRTVVGNEVTIIKLERSQDGTGSRNNQESSNENNQNENVPSLSFGGNSDRMSGSGRMGRPGGGEMDADAQAQMLERIKEMSSGEETVIIPVGIQMLKFSTLEENSEPTMVEASLGDVVTDKMISVWLDEKVVDRKIASFVTITR